MIRIIEVDKNNIPIKKGDIVEVKNGYFTSDNGLFYVTHAPGDPGWLGNDFALRLINKNGTFSKRKDNIRFWPIMITVNNHEKAIKAREHNNKYATIEVNYPRLKSWACKKP